MTADFFKQQMERLMGLRFAPADLGTHWEALSDLPELVLEAAVTRAQRTRADFPTPVELRQDADQVAPIRADDEPESRELDRPILLGSLPDGTEIHATRLWNYYCEACSDSGMQEFWCGSHRRQPWLDIRICPLPKCKKLGDGYGHSWVQPCLCISWNPELKRRREQDAKYAAARPGKVSA